MVTAKLLIVEGNDDLSLISNIMKKRIKDWYNPKEIKPNNYLVQLVLSDPEESSTGGKSKITYKNVSFRSKSEYTHIGIVVDADHDFAATKDKISAICKQASENYLSTVYDFWIMPDNLSNGMIEDFALSLTSESPLLAYSETVSRMAKNEPYCAPYKKIHATKSKIRTWLAWQDEPGIRIGHAINKGIINADSPQADKFVNWFSGFYNLEKK